jgi:hypothetical protein
MVGYNRAAASSPIVFAAESSIDINVEAGRATHLDAIHEVTLPCSTVNKVAPDTKRLLQSPQGFGERPPRAVMANYSAHLERRHERATESLTGEVLFDGLIARQAVFSEMAKNGPPLKYSSHQKSVLCAFLASEMAIIAQSVGMSESLRGAIHSPGVARQRVVHEICTQTMSWLGDYTAPGLLLMPIFIAGLDQPNKTPHVTYIEATKQTVNEQPFIFFKLADKFQLQLKSSSTTKSGRLRAPVWQLSLPGEILEVPQAQASLQTFISPVCATHWEFASRVSKLEQLASKFSPTQQVNSRTKSLMVSLPKGNTCVSKGYHTLMRGRLAASHPISHTPGFNEKETWRAFKEWQRAEAERQISLPL